VDRKWVVHSSDNTASKMISWQAYCWCGLRY